MNVIKDHFTEWFFYVGEIRVKACKNVDRALGPSKGQGTAFSSGIHPQQGCLLMLFLSFLITNICLHGCQFGQEYRRKNQGLLTTRSPCDTTFHSIKEVKVLLPWVWFTREKEREKVVMLLHYSECHGEETGQQTWVMKTLIKPVQCSLHIGHADQPW